MSPSRRPECTAGATRSTTSSLPRKSSHTFAQAGPLTPARATSDSSSALSDSRAEGASGTDTARSKWPPEPVHTSAVESATDLRSDSTTWSRSSSRGMARDRREPNVGTTSSGASRSP